MSGYGSTRGDHHWINPLKKGHPICCGGRERVAIIARGGSIGNIVK